MMLKYYALLASNNFKLFGDNVSGNPKLFIKS